MKRSRRSLLAAGGASVVAASSTMISGCLDFAAGEGAQGPEGTPETLSCADEGFVRLDQPFSEPVEIRTTATATTTIELSVEGTSETYGGTLRLSLRNSGGESATALGEHAYSIQRETASGWADVRGSSTGDDVHLPRTEERLDRNEGYGWSLTLREEDLADAVPDVDLAVCPPLGPGTHRFVYWGIEDAPPVGIEFELVG